MGVFVAVMEDVTLGVAVRERVAVCVAVLVRVALAVSDAVGVTEGEEKTDSEDVGVGVAEHAKPSRMAEPIVPGTRGAPPPTAVVAPR